MRFDRDTLIKWGSILFLIAVLPFAMELILVIDVFGLEFAASFAFLYMGMARERLLVRWREFKKDVTDMLLFFGKLYLFQPRVIVTHSIGSSVLLAFACTSIFACALWIPAFYLSSGFV